MPSYHTASEKIPDIPLVSMTVSSIRIANYLRHSCEEGKKLDSFLSITSQGESFAFWGKQKNPSAINLTMQRQRFSRRKK